MTGCFDRQPDISVDATFTSPDFSRVATLYTMMGGGAAGWCYRYVSLRPQKEQFDSARGVVFQTRCSVQPTIRWSSPAKLNISYPPDTTIYAHEPTWSGGTVQIIYEQK